MHIVYILSSLRVPYSMKYYIALSTTWVTSFMASVFYNITFLKSSSYNYFTLSVDISCWICWRLPTLAASWVPSAKNLMISALLLRAFSDLILYPSNKIPQTAVFLSSSIPSIGLYFRGFTKRISTLQNNTPRPIVITFPTNLLNGSYRLFDTICGESIVWNAIENSQLHLILYPTLITYHTICLLVAYRF